MPGLQRRLVEQLARRPEAQGLFTAPVGEVGLRLANAGQLIAPASAGNLTVIDTVAPDLTRRPQQRSQPPVLEGKLGDDEEGDGDIDATEALRQSPAVLEPVLDILRHRQGGSMPIRPGLQLGDRVTGGPEGGVLS